MIVDTGPVAQLPVLPFTAPDGSPRECPVRDEWSRKLVTCKRRYCPRCGPTWARAWGTVTSINLEAYGGPVALVSITAPGADVLPWACEREHKHSGPKHGCQVEAAAADAWSKAAPANWRKMRDAARRAVARGGVEPPRILERVWEPQKRGVPHLHLVVGMATPAERESARRFVDELHRLAPDYLFGFVDRKLAPIAAAEAARYLTSYLLGRGSRKSTIRENISDPRMPASLVWLTPVLTRATHVKMRTLRRARWVLTALAGTSTVYPQVHPEHRFEVASACCALERVRIRRAARGPDDVERAERTARLGFTRAMAAMYGRWGPSIDGPPIPLRAAA